MTSRGRGVRARKIEKPRPLRTQLINAATTTTAAAKGGNLLSLKSVVNNIDEILFDEMEMDRIVGILTSNGAEFEKSSPDDMNALFNTFREAIRSSHVSPMIRCLLLNVLEQRAKKWNQPLTLIDYYERKKHDLENFNIQAIQARKRPCTAQPIQPIQSALPKLTQPLQQIQNLNGSNINDVSAKKRDLPTPDDNTWEPNIQNLSLQSNNSSISTISSGENMDLSNGNGSESGNGSTRPTRVRGRGSRRSSRSSEGSVRKQDDDDLPGVGRPSSRASIRSEVDEVFDSVDGAAVENAEVAAVPNVGDGQGDVKKEAEASLNIGGEVVMISCPNKSLVEGVHKLIIRYKTALEKFLVEGVLDTNIDQKMYGNQGYYVPKRVRTSSSSDNYDQMQDNGNNRRGNYQPRDYNTNRDLLDANTNTRDTAYGHRRFFDSLSTTDDTVPVRPHSTTYDTVPVRAQFSNTPVAAKLSEAIESYEDKKKEDKTYDAGLDWYATREVEKMTGVVRDNMGYLVSQDVARQPITPTSSLRYVAKIQLEQPGDGSDQCVRGRRVQFSRTSQKYWSNVKEESLVKEGGSPGTMITYPKDFLLSCGSSATALKIPINCDWASIAAQNPIVCLEKVSNMDIAMKIFNFSTWQPKEYTGFRSSVVGYRERENQASSHQREYPLSADSTKFTRPNFEPYTRSKSVEESTGNMRPWDIGKSSDPQESLCEKIQRNPDWVPPSRRYSGSDSGRQNSWSDTSRQNLSNFTRREFSFNFPSSSTEKKDFNFGRSFGTSTNKFSGTSSTSNGMGLLLEESTRSDH